MSRLGRDPATSEITPERLYLRRREFIRNAALFTATSAGVGGGLLWLMQGGRAEPKPPVVDGGTDADQPALEVARRGPYGTGEPQTPFRDVTTYNNFYEFGDDKSDPTERAGTLRTRPWTIAVEGEVHRPQVIDIDTLLGWFPLEERVYRMRCVEAPVDGHPVARASAR